MPERVVIVSDEEQKTTKDNRPIYVVVDEEGREYSTLERVQAQVAHIARENGQHVLIDFTEKQGGQFNQFTNRYINSIRAVADDSPGNEPDKQPTTLFDDAAPPPETPVRISETERQLMIVAQSSLARAIETVPLLDTDEKISPTTITDIADYYGTWAVEWARGGA